MAAANWANGRGRLWEGTRSLHNVRLGGLLNNPPSGGCPTKVGTLFMLLVLVLSLVAGPAINVKAAEITFAGEELLARPTDTSITINIVPDETIEYYYEYGTASGVYSAQTATATATGDQPHQVVINGLEPNTRYYYRMQYRTGGDPWVARPEHSFHTQRARGSTFTFTIISDSHMNGGGGNVSLYEQTLENVAEENPDFHLDLGDTFWMDGVTSSTTANQRYLAQRQWMGTISHSAAIFVATGNHENEEGWNFDDTPSKALLSVNARKRYYPSPITDGFYSGNDDPLPAIDGDHLREDYYAWEWGDALFVVIDPFQYTMIKPYSGTAGGEDNDETVIGDRWDWTLGQQQFEWFKETLENSDATFKFVFAHHLLGGTEDYVRGGAGPAHMFEWGGYNADGTTWGWDSERPGWGSDPIRQLMIDNGVSAFFHGHDHEYAYEMRDGIVYQLVPSPSMTGYGFDLYHETDPYTIKVLPNSGHLRVTVSPSQATVDYVGTSSGTVNYSYTILAAAPTRYLTTAVSPEGGGTTDPAVGVHSYADGSVVNVTATPASGYEFSSWSGACTGSGACSVTMDADKAVTAHFISAGGISGGVDGDGIVNSTDALIIVSCDVGMDTSQFCPMNCGDVNGDGYVNSTDALIILSYDVGMSVPYPVGEPGCPSSVTPCAGCAT
jgi:hypothetical protein